MDETASPQSSQADFLFAHLAELVDEVPAMRERGEKLAQARAAREVLDCERYRDGQDNELKSVAERFRQLVRDFDEARERGDEAAASACESALAGVGNMKAIREGALASAQRALDQALVAGGFDSIEQARALVMDDDALMDLEHLVEGFKADYAETLQACQDIERDGEGGKSDEFGE